MFHYICLESLILYQENLLNCQHWCLPFGCAGATTLAASSSSSSELGDFPREEQAMRRSVISLPEIAAKVVLGNKRTVYFPGLECAVLLALTFPTAAWDARPDPLFSLH